MAKITPKMAFETGKGLVLGNGLGYFDGKFYQIGIKGAVPVKAVNQAKLKADHAAVIANFNRMASETTISVRTIASPAGLTTSARREWVKSFTASARRRGVYQTA